MLAAALVLCLAAVPTKAASYKEHQQRRPALFDPQTGYRIARQRAPTPDDIPGPAQLVGPRQTQNLLARGALALDVFGATQSRFDELDGTWLVSKPRHSLPGAVWLPETGRGRLDETMRRYLANTLDSMTPHRDHPIVVYCIADCWMSWNAAQRIAALGYTRVYWFRLGTDGWRDIGAELEIVEPKPVAVD